MSTRPVTATAPHVLPIRGTARDAAAMPAGVAARIERAVSRLGDRLHEREDASASAEGWQVDRTPWGGRRYRHPAFTQRSTWGPSNDSTSNDSTTETKEVH